MMPPVTRRLSSVACAAMFALGLLLSSEAQAEVANSEIELDEYSPNRVAISGECERPSPEEGLSDDAAGGENEEPEERDPLSESACILELIETSYLAFLPDDLPISGDFWPRLLEPPRS